MNTYNKIGHWSWKYATVKFLARSAFYIFYRKIYISGTENIPEGGGIIFGANHQNALMDALAVIFTNRYQPVYLARADIFRNPVMARILRFLKIMPVYRFRDGIEGMGRNEDTFDMTSAVLAGGGCIGIMPEGNHGEQKRLRVLKKGIFRIAFRAEEVNENKAGIKIVPVGLDYSNTRRIFGELAVNYGKPLEVSRYSAIYSQHPQKGINEMKEDLAGSLGSLMIDIKDEQNYSRDKLMLDIGSSVLQRRHNLSSMVPVNVFFACRILCQCLYQYFEQNPGYAEKLRSKSGRLDELIETYGILPQSLDKPGKFEILISLLRNILCFPVFITGFMLHIIPLGIIHVVLKKLKDPQFISSFKFVLGMLLIPLNYVFLAVLFFLHFSPVIALVVLALTPLAGIAAYRCLRFSRSFRNKMEFIRLCRLDSEIGKLISDLRSEIISELEPVFQIAEEKLK
ncbi:MAG: 1-acyl-sn-glycerol-3-phosphate acyltransferase [Bacteroidales bacterium]